MPLFQKSVKAKYLNDLDATLLDSKFKEFKSYFGNAEIQENIRNAKEEQFQEGFLRKLFVKILCYAINPESNSNNHIDYKLSNLTDEEIIIVKTAFEFNLNI